MRPTLACGVLLGWGLAACGGDSSAPTSPPIVPGFASLVVVIPPANATPTGSFDLPWSANFVVSLFEEGNVGVELSEIVVELGNDVVYDSAEILLAAQSRRVEPRGSLAIPLSIAFEDSALLARVVVRGLDDNQNAVEAVGRLVVVPAQGP